MRKSIALAAIAAACLLSACTTTDVASLAESAEKLDPSCGKKVDLVVTPVLIFGWPVPLIAGTYSKSCNPDQFRQP
jgi:hypothetical protein